VISSQRNQGGIKLQEKTLCPWCDAEVEVESQVVQRTLKKVVERKCSQCGNIISALSEDEQFFEKIRERVLSFKN
jgi:hypothetical protein